MSERQRRCLQRLDGGVGWTVDMAKAFMAAARRFFL
jgi:hypothetical protein